MGVIDFPRIGSYIPDGRERVVAENDRIVFTEEFRMEENSPLEIDLTESSAVPILSERNEPSGESHGFGLETVFAEKERREIGSERLREHDIEPFGSAAVQEHIMDETDFFLWRHKRGNIFPPVYPNTGKLK